MPVLDTRQLVFDAESLREAMRADSHVARALRLSVSAADAIFLSPAEQVVEVAQAAGSAAPGAGAPVLHRLGAQQVAALLIAYCIRAGIPVPRNCRKSIRIDADRIELHFAKRIAAIG